MKPVNTMVEAYTTKSGIKVEIWRIGVGQYAAKGFLPRDGKFLIRYGLTQASAKNNLARALKNPMA